MCTRFGTLALPKYMHDALASPASWFRAWLCETTGSSKGAVRHVILVSTCDEVMSGALEDLGSCNVAGTIRRHEIDAFTVCRFPQASMICLRRDEATICYLHFSMVILRKQNNSPLPILSPAVITARQLLILNGNLDLDSVIAALNSPSST